MSTLYVSDLDGTLLRSNEATSEYTNNVINKLELPYQKKAMELYIDEYKNKL